MMMTTMMMMTSCLHVLVLGADKVRQEFALAAKVDGTDGTRDFATGAR